MKVRRYLVDNMSEALSQIRIELGKDAVILSHRKVRQKGIRGVFGKKQLEVTAAVENHNSKVRDQKLPENNMIQQENTETIDFNESLRVMTEAIKQHSDNNIREKEPEENTLDITEIYRNKVKENIQGTEKKSEDKKIMDELNELKGMISRIKSDEHEEVQSAGKAVLEDLDINKEHWDKLLKKIGTNDQEEDIKNIIREDVEGELQHLKFPESGRIVLAGPTGVGKTTTIAKLAGKYALKGNKKVGLITIDTYRIGAVEQLKTYAEIMNLPIKVVFTLKEMEAALDDLKHCDIILVDTTGRSSKNNMQVSELRSYIQKVETDNVFLVVSAATKNKDLKTIVNGFKSLDYNGLVVTKLDETSAYGVIYNAFKEADKPLSLITTGQNVPEDIRDADIQFVSKLIAGKESV